MNNTTLFLLIGVGFLLGLAIMWFVYPWTHPMPKVEEKVRVDTVTEVFHDTAKIAYPVTHVRTVTVHDTVDHRDTIFEVQSYSFDTTFTIDSGEVEEKSDTILYKGKVHAEAVVHVEFLSEPINRFRNAWLFLNPIDITFPDKYQTISPGNSSFSGFFKGLNLWGAFSMGYGETGTALLQLGSGHFGAGYMMQVERKPTILGTLHF